MRAFVIHASGAEDLAAAVPHPRIVGDAVLAVAEGKGDAARVEEERALEPGRARVNDLRARQHNHDFVGRLVMVCCPFED